MPSLVDVKVFLVYIVDVIKFTKVRFGIELRQFLIRQKYSLACSVLSESSKYVFPFLVVALGCL
jgi:hypothetical protein